VNPHNGSEELTLRNYAFLLSNEVIILVSLTNEIKIRSLIASAGSKILSHSLSLSKVVSLSFSEYFFALLSQSLLQYVYALVSN
jgi:hypothetical protein